MIIIWNSKHGKCRWSVVLVLIDEFFLVYMDMGDTSPSASWLWHWNAAGMSQLSMPLIIQFILKILFAFEGLSCPRPCVHKFLTVCCVEALLHLEFLRFAARITSDIILVRIASLTCIRCHSPYFTTEGKNGVVASNVVTTSVSS